MMMTRNLALVSSVAALVDPSVKVPEELETAFEAFFPDKVTGSSWVTNMKGPNTDGFPGGVANKLLPANRPTGYPGVGTGGKGFPDPKTVVPGPTRNTAPDQLAQRFGDWDLLVAGNEQPKHADEKRILFVDPVRLEGDVEGPSQKIREWISHESEDDKGFEMNPVAVNQLKTPGDVSDVIDYETEKGDKLLVMHVVPVQAQTKDAWKSGEEANLRAYYGALKAFIGEKDGKASKVKSMVLPTLGCQEWNVPEWVDNKAGDDFPGAPAYSGNLAIRELGTLFLAYLALPAESKTALEEADEKKIEFWRNGGDDECEKGMRDLTKHGHPVWFDIPAWLNQGTLVEDSKKRDAPFSRHAVMRVAMRLAENMGYDTKDESSIAKLRTEKLEQKTVTPEPKPEPKPVEKPAPTPKPVEKAEPKAPTKPTNESWGWTPIIIGAALVLACLGGVLACLVCRQSGDVDSDV